MATCSACGSTFEVLEDDIGIDKGGRAYITCYNNKGHKKKGPHTIVIRDERIMSDPELLEVVEKKRNALGILSKEGVEKEVDKKMEEEYRDGKRKRKMQKSLTPGDPPEEKDIAPGDQTLKMSDEMNDDEITADIRQRGREALDELKRNTLERRLSMAGMPKNALKFVLEDFDEYPDVRSNPQMLYQMIKGYANIGKGQTVKDFYLQRIVESIMKLERMYGGFTASPRPIPPFSTKMGTDIPPDPQGYLSGGEVEKLIAKALQDREKEAKSEEVERRREEEIRKLFEEIRKTQMMVSHPPPSPNPGGNQDFVSLLDTVLKNIKPAGGDSSGIASTAFKEAVSILKSTSEAKALGLPSGVPASVWLETQKMAHERDLKKTDIMETERERENTNKLVKDIVGIFGPALPGVINIVRGKTTPGQQAQLGQLLSQAFTPEEQEQLADSINAKLQPVQSLPEPEVETVEETEKKGKSISVCPECQTAIEYPLGVKVVECFSCGEKFRVDFICKKCGTNVLYNVKSESFKCPVCGAKYRLKKQKSVK
ncbi:MAG: hypothetical protein EF807_02235 [Candidatus Methanolliviera hydrocarbonicum]|uniref:Uncharacterized protein n=1 Tax=Candidatus Methanolliviera hydrocarbonicum TaxID=2491085 RepID=A0A520KY08_9EURY|nr:MAG: hypothetical protein EF807_02235 [Candidatus Methanolliviera hydrocarbonicum]